MPVLRRQIELENSNEETFKDNEEVFYCESTKEIFRNYEDYFKRVMLINSMVWTCELSGRTDLTYNEALQSEKSSRKLAKLYPLKIPTLLLANQLKSKCTSWKDLMEEISNYLKQRFCIGETVAILENKKSKKYYIVTDVFTDKPKEDDPEAYRYKLKPENPSNNSATFETVKASELFRPNIYQGKSSFNRDRLKIFLRQFMYQKDNLLYLKEEIFKKYIDEDPNKLWRQHFPSKLPVFESSKRYEMIVERLNTKKIKEENKKNGEAKSNSSKKKVNGEKNNQNGKQTSISKYLTKTSNDNKQASKESSKNKEEGPSMLEKMRIREEERKKKVEQEKERQKNITALASKTVRELNQVNQEDLLLRDMRPIPSFKPVTTLLPMEYFGDFVAILEFMHSFSDLLTMKDKFQDGMTMDILERALLLRESSGPLNDILQVLLSSIFWLQLEEEEYCDIQYFTPDRNIKTMVASDNEKRTYFAARAAKYANKYYGSKLTELPMDTFTINELIRLHLLSSGACVSPNTSRWRFQNRGGYQSIDDPGFEFCNKYPYIVKFLETSTVFELPFDDLLKIILCLINQIQTYSSVRTEIEERLEQSTTARINLKNLYTKQRRLKAEMASHKAELHAENIKNLAELLTQDPPPPDIDSLRQEIESKYQTMQEKSMLKFEKQLKELDKEFAKYKQDLFAFQMLLGTDRAYRNYWMFESLPGIFIEHCPPNGKCLETKPDILPGLADCAPEQRYKFIKNYVTKKFFNDEELNKENINEGSVIGNTTDAATSMNGVDGVASLFMCTTNEADCPVHTVDHPTYIQWSYINTEDELNALIKSLNSLGIRERQLKECLELQKNLILDHIINCPVEKVSTDLSQKDVILDKMIKNMKRYATSGTDDDPNLVLELATRENIFDLFDKVTTGHLGHIKIRNEEKWGENIMLGNYAELNFKIIDLETISAREWVDPGEYINDLISTLDDKSMVQYTNNNNNEESVKKLGLALLQIQKGIDKKFLKQPFGGKDSMACERLNLDWQTGLLSCRNFSQIMLHYNVMYDAILWSKSIERAYCRVCRRRNEPEKMLLCDDCNAGYHMHCLKPKLKSIPTGDWFCVKCKPISEKKQKKTAKFSEEGDEDEFDETLNNTTLIDETDHSFRMQTDDSDEDNEAAETKSSDNDSADEDVEEESEGTKQKCKLCSIDFDDEDEFQLVECEKCPLVCHMECAIPPLKHKPRHWICWRCNKKQNKTKQEKPKKKKNKKKRKDENVTNEVTVSKKSTRVRKSPVSYDETESHEKPPKARKRRMINEDSDNDGSSSKVKRSRRSLDHETHNDNHSNNANRRSRQNDLPLHHVVLHGLLDEISRHEDSWPFNRPVSKVDVPDYYQIIKIPMDFAKIKSRLNVGHYASDYDIMNDIQQVFINCDLYNNSASDIYKAGIRLENFVQSKCMELNLPFRPSDMITDDFEEDDKIPLKKIANIERIGMPAVAQTTNVIMNGD